jgi:hypothetical protein
MAAVRRENDAVDPSATSKRLVSTGRQIDTLSLSKSRPLETMPVAVISRLALLLCFVTAATAASTRLSAQEPQAEASRVESAATDPVSQWFA